GLLADLAAHARHHILVGFELAAQAVVLAQVMVVLTRVAMDHQHLASIGGHHVAKGGNYRGVWHPAIVSSPQAWAASMRSSTDLSANGRTGLDSSDSPSSSTSRRTSRP